MIRSFLRKKSFLMASSSMLNYLGKKCFAFSTLGTEIIPAILEHLPLMLDLRA